MDDTSKTVIPVTEPVKVLHLISSKGLYGAERVVMTLVQQADPKLTVPVMAIFRKQGTGGDEFVREAESLGFHVETIQYSSAFDPGQILNLFRVVRRQRPRIIHAHEYKTNILGFFVARMYGIPIVSTVHALHRLEGRAKAVLRFSVWLLRYFKALIAVSKEVRDELVELNVPQEKITTIQNVPPLTERKHETGARSLRNELGVPADMKLIGFLGRLIPAKGCDQLLRALAMAGREHRDIFLAIVGEGPERDALEALAKSLGLQDMVRFCGFRQDPENVYASLDLLVLPSREEGTPLVMLEGMWQEVPVVATSVGGIPEVITDGKTGRIVPPDNPAALAAAIIEVLGNPENARKRALEAKNTLRRRYDVKVWAGKVQDVYRDAMRRTPAGVRGV
ncbi:glycosyltransferase [Candidatus Moduliflexota bacterium]